MVPPRRPSPAATDMPGLFAAEAAPAPLAERLRPAELGQVVGQQHLLGPSGPIGRMIAAQRLGSFVLWGPPGCGKTTIARLLAREARLEFQALSAVFATVADLRRVFEEARARRQLGQGTLLFIDEIHRFNRAQQDSFLPVMEDGTLVLVGATTENPSFELNAALLSRAQVFVLRRLDAPALQQLLERAEAAEGRSLPVLPDAREALLALADGDGRYLLTLAEALFALPAGTAPLRPDGLAELLQRRAPVYDKAQESHYNLISALHKSLRGSDADAALYWFCRMLDGGEDPHYIARRILRFSVEDVGLADPQAQTQVLHAWEVYERLGSPEGELALAQAVLYLATAPKSNAGYMAYKAGRRMARETGSLMPPAHILNAPTKLMRKLGYGEGYNYDHDAPDAFSGQNYFPDGIARAELYRPVARGFERELGKRMAWFDKLREQRQQADGPVDGAPGGSVE